MTQTATTITVDSLPVANSIDPVQDYTLIYTHSATDIQGINRNTYLGLSSQPLGLTDSQSPQNKVLDNTNSLTVKDTLFTLQDDGDVTKQTKFQLSGITTGTTRTLTIPNVSDTLVGLTATQTLTNKTLASPVITGGSVDNSTVTIDTLSGHTTSNTGTVYGVSVTSGVIASAALAGSVNNAALSLSAGVTSYTNSGACGGTFYYSNFGGIKEVWGTTGSFSTSTSTAQQVLVFPTSFFSTIQEVTGSIQSVASSAAQYYVGNGLTGTSSFQFYIFTISGTGSATASFRVRGT